MLKDDILKVLEVFDKNKITEHYQREIFNDGGVDFNFTYGDPDYGHINRRLDIFQFAAFLDLCNAMQLNINANEIVRAPWAFEPEELVRNFADGKIQRKLF